MPRTKNVDPKELNLSNDSILKLMRSVRRTIVARVLGVTRGTVTSWCNDGVPWFDQHSQFCDLVEATQWFIKMNSGDETTLKQQKMQKEIDYKDAQIRKMSGMVIDRSEHEQILSTRAASLRQFLEQTAILNAARFVDLSLDQARVQLLDLFTQAMESYTGASVEKVPVENTDD